MANYRTIIFSDLHLGTRHARVEKLIEFLKENESDNLFIVGDFIDGWALKKKWYWDSNYNLLIQKILRKSRKGTNVVYFAGNHDEFLREFIGNDFGGIKIVDDLIYTSSNGKKYLILHGDKFDGILNSLSFISKLGSWAYDVILDLNLILNKIRQKMGYNYWSLSHFVKSNTKKATQYCFSFEKALVKEASRYNVDGVICGHIHSACKKYIDGIEYINSGSWVEHCNAIVELEDGTFKVLDLDDQKGPFN